MAEKAKLYSSPLPLRAIYDERLSGLDLRVLACIASHDRMSLARGEGQGCWASHETLSIEVGCNYINLGKSIKKLAECGFVERSSPPFGDRRGHVYRVPGWLYGREESLSFGKRSARTGKSPNSAPAAGKVGQAANDPPGMVCHDIAENGGKLPETASQYISLSDGVYPPEGGEDTHLEDARLTARDARQDGNGSTVGAQLARFERALKQQAPGLDVLAWVRWLETVQDNYSTDTIEGGWALRLLEEATDAMSEEQFAEWQSGEPRTVLPVASLAEPFDTIREFVADQWRQLNPAGRDVLAKSAGINAGELRQFVEGRAELTIGKQMALRASLQEAA